MEGTTGTWRIRTGRDSDGPALIALIWACWSAYRGIRMDVDGEMPELHTLATSYASHGGKLWVAETNGRVTGMIAVRPMEAAVWEVCQVYADPALHGSGLGHALLDQAEYHAVTAGAKRLVLWSDTRFDRAHRFYEKRSYVRHGAVRVLKDISNSLEYGYAKPVCGVEKLDVAAATSAIGRLAAVLVACVDDGISICFGTKLAADRATAFWRSAVSAVAAGQLVILAGWRDGILLGTAILDLGDIEGQPHRAVVRNILVEPNQRRRGLGRQLLRGVVQAAAEHGRSLLTSKALAGEAGEALYRAAGWHEAGRVPDFARDKDGTGHAAALLWKRI